MACKFVYMLSRRYHDKIAKKRTNLKLASVLIYICQAILQITNSKIAHIVKANEETTI